MNKHCLNYILSVIFFVFCESAASLVKSNTKTLWSLNDVTYILPLPGTLQQNYLRSVKNHISEAILNDLPKLSVQYDREALYKMIFALVIRIEPASKQIRVVWQPVTLGPQNKVTTLDMALHSFYQLSEVEFHQLLSEIILWKEKYKIQSNFLEPLNIHPVFKNQTSDIKKIVLQDLNDLFFKYCHDNNTVKVTAMVLRGGNDMWAFMGFNIDLLSQQRMPIEIPRTASSTAQRFVNQAVPAEFFENALISPLAFNIENDSLENLVMKATFNSQLTEDEILKALHISHRFENPRIHNTESLDCVSCHIAHPAREWISRHLKAQPKNNHLNSVYQNQNYNLTNLSTEVFNTVQIRGLGYFGRNLTISQRVIHESAEVADYLNFQNNIIFKKKTKNK